MFGFISDSICLFIFIYFLEFNTSSIAFFLLLLLFENLCSILEHVIPQAFISQVFIQEFPGLRGSSHGIFYAAFLLKFFPSVSSGCIIPFLIHFLI